MTAAQENLDYYARPAAMTSGGAHAPRFDELPRDVASLVRVVQGLLLHQHWAQTYGVELSDERRSESHLRPTDRMLDRLLAHSDHPLSVARPLDARLVGTCRNITVLLVALLRAKGVPARARCGFGGYFAPGDFVDHWVCEHWNAAESRWVLVDAQIDDVQGAALKPDFDVLDVPRDRFLVAGDAWAKCRAGEADPSRFGFLDMRGLWFIAGNVVRDLAALNLMEMLPWDDWGAIVGPDEPLRDDQLALFDRLAAVTRSPDAAFAELRSLYEGDERLRVPQTVFNVVLNRQDTL
ncbi:transglutaminase-like domain-containing protein [Sorangium sp. So ce1182]|uniref:transglutaminase-like domain-containing protein n=1 Tax=Sorangium sp. So ce1182 TaxID=3133334 RepID=UPI003F61A58D